jgi:hypothetical protein
MEKLTIYKNKGETFRCHFNIEGASPKDTTVRLCLEFDNNTNLFFYGSLNEDGGCVIEIPRLKNLEEKRGKLTVEAIADSIYFKVYEADIELRNSVEVTMQQPTVKKAKPATNVELEGILQDPKPTPAKKEQPHIFEKKEEEEPATTPGWRKMPWTPPKYKPAEDKEVAEETSSKKKFRSFNEFVKKQRS